MKHKNKVKICPVEERDARRALEYLWESYQIAEEYEREGGETRFQTRKAFFRTGRMAIPAGGIWGAYHHSRLVSVLALGRDMERINPITGWLINTPKEMRRKGYAALLTRGVGQVIRETTGASLILPIYQNNKAAIATAKKAGFRKLCNVKSRKDDARPTFYFSNIESETEAIEVMRYLADLRRPTDEEWRKYCE